MHVAHYWSHSFLPDFIRPDGVVFDFGVNNGGFSRLVAPRCARVIGFEPNPTWLKNDSLPGNVQVFPKALAAKAEVRSLHLNPHTCSSLNYSDADSEEVQVSTLTFAEAMGLEPTARIDLVKMDIEGEEVPVLQTAPVEALQRVGQMSVEFHDFLDASTIPTIRGVITRMKSLGFLAFKMSWHNYGDILFVNQRQQTLSLLDRFYLRVPHKYGAGLGRILRRKLLRNANGG
jgi:FkbM family methyltransferase